MITERTSASLLGLHAQTALHPGAGTALGLVDLPIQRERHTGWPTIPGSALKGILRDRCRERISILRQQDQQNADYDLFDAEKPDSLDDVRKGKKGVLGHADASRLLTDLFGPPTDWAGEFAGALSVTDARLVAFPVRSLRGVFAWVTCRSALERLKADADLAAVDSSSWQPVGADVGKFTASTACQCVHGDSQKYVILEEFDYSQEAGDCAAAVDAIAEWLSSHIMTSVSADRLKRQLVVLSDDDFSHFARHATEIVARIRLNYESKTVEQGALFYQELLPAESALYSVVIANPTRARRKSAGANGGAARTDLLTRLAGLVKSDAGMTVFQIGGDETTGKGLCAVSLAGGD